MATKATKQITVINKLGIHARPAALFVKVASKFESHITVEKDGETINGKSIMGLMMLAAGHGSKLAVTAEGRDAEAALKALEELFLQKFNED
jgi:phosphocarrier protein HPr